MSTNSTTSANNYTWQHITFESPLGQAFSINILHYRYQNSYNSPHKSLTILEHINLPKQLIELPKRHIIGYMKDDYHLYEGIIDSHFHQLEMTKKDLDPELIIKNCISKGLTYALDISTNTDSFDERLSFADKFPEIYISAGLSVGKAEDPISEIDSKLSQLEKQLDANKENPKLKALGETGLDRYWNYGDKLREMHLFETQVMLADKYSLPVIIHNRDADMEILEILTRLKPSKGGIIHCFSTDWFFAEKALDLGFMISFAGNLTYKKTEDMRDACRKTPLSSILIETDAPFLTPQKVRKYKNHPGFIGYTYDLAAELKGIKPEKLVSAVENNFKRLLSIN